MTAPVPSMTQACTIRFAKSKATILDSVMVDLPPCSGTLRCRVGHDRDPFVQDREGPSHHPEVRGGSRASKERTPVAQEEGEPQRIEAKQELVPQRCHKG